MKNQIRYLQNIFHELLNDYGQAYLAIKHSENTDIGKRGFSEEEKKQGLILVFNRKNHKDLQWTSDGSITVNLGFGVGNRPERCFIYSDDIVSVFSPDAQVKFDRWDARDAVDLSAEPGKAASPKSNKAVQEKVISLDSFRKTKN
jgi:hypothetical protein